MTAILFTQVATAAYACPAMSGAESIAGGAADMAGMPCAEAMSAGMLLDADQPGLCQQHCQFGSTQQPADPLPPPGVAVPAPLLWYAVPPVVAPSGGPAAWAERQRLRERVPRPPHSLLHCCYRI